MGYFIETVVACFAMTFLVVYAIGAAAIMVGTGVIVLAGFAIAVGWPLWLFLWWMIA